MMTVLHQNGNCPFSIFRSCLFRIFFVTKYSFYRNSNVPFDVAKQSVNLKFYPGSKKPFAEFKKEKEIHGGFCFREKPRSEKMEIAEEH